MYILYHFPLSPYARRVVALLEEAQLAFETKLVDLPTGAHLSAEFRAINPNHQVPVLVDGDLRLAESHAILRYLCARHDLYDWYPADAKRRALVDQWLDWDLSRLGPALGDIIVNKVFLGEQGDKAAIQRGEARVADTAPVLEQRLAQSPFVAGDTPTIADLAIASDVTQLQLAAAAPATPAIGGWLRSVNALRGVEASSVAIQSMIRARL
jgi:glutathione S-transferase